MKITFIPMQEEHLPLWKKWIKNPHVRDVWFIEGYETEDVIQEKLQGNGYDYPFIIDVDDKSIGYIQCLDRSTGACGSSRPPWQRVLHRSRFPTPIESASGLCNPCAPHPAMSRNLR